MPAEKEIGMKLFIQEVQMDIKQGILYKYQRYVIAILLGCVLAMFYVTTCFSCAGQGKDIINEFYVGRYAVVFFQGKNIQSDKRCRVYDSDRIYDVTALSFLYDWGLHFKDLLGVGKNILVRTQKRVFWC